jgi:hypothetical protein
MCVCGNSGTDLVGVLGLNDDKINLGALRMAIQDALFVLDHEHDGNASDKSGGDSDSESESVISDTRVRLDKILEGLQTDTRCLLDLDLLIKFAVPDSSGHQIDHEPPNSKVITRDWTPHSVFSDRVSRRFPDADTSLVERLAKANLDRFLRAKLEREINRLASEEARRAAEAAIVAEIGGELAPVPAASEGGTKYHDSGLGTSIATPSSYAETVMSYRQDESSCSVSIPPLPEGAREGEPFECVACARMLTITNNSVWK